MSQPLLFISLSLAVLLSANVVAQNPVSIQFQADPVQVTTATQIVFTAVTVPSAQILSITWTYQGTTLGLWSAGNSVVNSVSQFQGRVTITANQLQIANAQLQDAGSYTVVVIPIATTGLTQNSKTVQLNVFDAVAGVSVIVPSVAMEGKNTSLSCTWTSGTAVAVQWVKGGVTITSDSRITISGGFLIINPASRSDAGTYTCTASNPVSRQSATNGLTVYYGPDTPALTVDRPKQCVGGGDLLAGQTLRITCTSASLPAAVFSWSRAGQPINGQPNTGVLSFQTSSTNDSGQYVCTASNSVTGGTSTQSANVAVVGVCLDGGEVAGIVIGSFLGLLIIVLLIVLLICLVRRRRVRRRREQQNVFVHKTDPIQRPVPPDPQTNNVRDLGRGPQPPLYHMNTQTRQPDHLIMTQHESHGNPQTQPLNGLHNSYTHQNNERTNRPPHNAGQNVRPYPDNGIENPAFTQTEAQNANTLPNTQQPNPNVLIQTGGGQGGNQPPAVQVSLNSLPQATNSNANAQAPTINVNLNSYAGNGQQTQPDRSFHPASQTNDGTSQRLNNLTNTEQSNPTMQSGQSYLNGHVNPDPQGQPALIPTGYTHFNGSNISLRDVNTQTNQQEPERHRRSDRNSGGRDTTSRSTLRQMPWDRLRGTPAYPSGALQGVQTSHEVDSYAGDYSTDYTIQPPIREGRATNRPPLESQTASRRRTPPRRDPPSEDSEAVSRSADRRHPNAVRVAQHERSGHTQRSPRTQRESAQQEIRGSQTAPRQETTHSNNPQALPLMSQQASAGRSAVSQGPTTQPGLAAPQSADTRALADPNHLQQAHMAQQHIAAPIQMPQGRSTHTQPATNGASQPRQQGTAPVPNPSAQTNHGNLTQAALIAHTERAQVFQNRRQQTQAALLQPSTQRTQPPVAATHRPPTPPPPIALGQFNNLPRERTQHRSPARGPQRNTAAPHHPTGMPTHNHRHPGHRHGHVQTRGHGHRVQNAPWQQQAHRGRPR